jgi:phytoene dehydrogenase-like protein
VRGVDNLFRVGGTAHPGGGLPLVMLGGRLVASMVGAAR